MTSVIEQGISLASAVDHDLVATFLTRRGAIRRCRSGPGRTGASAQVVAVACPRSAGRAVGLAVREALGVPLT
jgi:hypothetical protein